MKRFLTIGFKHDGTALILRQSNHERSVHTQAFEDLTAQEQKDYAEISVVEVGSRNLVRNRSFEARDPLVPINQPRNPTIPKGDHHETRVGSVTLRHVGAPLPASVAASANVPVTPVDPPLGIPTGEKVNREGETEYAALDAQGMKALKSIASAEGVSFAAGIEKADLINAILDHRAAQSAEFPPQS